MPNPLLPKARSLARNGAVTSLIAETGRLEGEVAVRGVGYRVRIGLPQWAGRRQKDAAELIAKALADSSGLASGDLPDALTADLARHGIGIAVPADERVATCTCSARRRPCVHVLTALYALVQHIDEHPMLAVELRTSGVEEPSDTDWIDLADIDPTNFYGEP